MPTLKLTQSAAKNLNPASKAYIAFDTELKGFGLRVMPSGKKTWIIEYRPHGGGRSVSKRRYTIAPFDSATNAQAARQMAMDVLARVRQGEDPAGDLSRGRKAETVAEMFAAFMTEHVEQYRKPKTIYEYRLLQRNYIDPSLSHIKANALSRTDIERFIRNSTKAGKKTTANRVLAVLSAAYSWGGKNGIVPPDHNPCKGIEKFKEQGRERFLSIEEINRLWRTLDEAVTTGLPYHVDETKTKAKHAPKPENRITIFDSSPIAAIKLLILTGCRLHEILDLEWSFIDFGRQLIFLPDSKTGKKAVLLSEPDLKVVE
ncbi:MAG: integrase arm-type DNA-binding domain-containing protein [Martelella sp.]|jgi:site-specific recombinase XerD|uniref:tyrosine-type recombinase/integrase n=1 Tax=Martelella sp. TaxID=1969699 RepID=UPI00324268C7